MEKATPGDQAAEVHVQGRGSQVVQIKAPAADAAAESRSVAARAEEERLLEARARELQSKEAMAAISLAEEERLAAARAEAEARAKKELSAQELKAAAESEGSRRRAAKAEESRAAMTKAFNRFASKVGLLDDEAFVKATLEISPSISVKQAQALWNSSQVGAEDPRLMGIRTFRAIGEAIMAGQAAVSPEASLSDAHAGRGMDRKTWAVQQEEDEEEETF